MSSPFVLDADPSALVTELVETLAADGGTIATLAGHYVLRKNGARLEPALGDRDGGQFAITSLGWGLDLVCLTRSKGLQNSLLLVVDDRKFVRYHTDPSEPKWAADLRREYFYRETHGPAEFAMAWRARGHEAASLLVPNNDALRGKDSVLPRETYLFSERALRNRFEKRTRDQLISRHLVEELEGNAGGSRELFIRMPAGTGAGRYCLTEDCSCGCGGEVAQLVIDLFDSGIRQFVLLVPFTCFEAVAGGAVAACALLENRRIGISPAIHVLSETANFGGIGTTFRRMTLKGADGE